MSETNNNTQAQKPKFSKLAMASLISSIMGVFIIPPLAFLMEPITLKDMLALIIAWLPPLGGLVLSVVALSQIKRTRVLLTGRRFAITGLLLSIFLLLILTWLNVFFIMQYNKRRVIRIEDVTQKTTVTLLNKNTQGYVCGIVIYITGYIDGPATITITPHKGGEGYKYNITKGRISLKDVNEWYELECFLEYEPTNVQSGFLSIKYYFLYSGHLT